MNCVNYFFFRDGPVTYALMGHPDFETHNNQDAEFDELQIMGNGHLAFLRPSYSESGGLYIYREHFSANTEQVSDLLQHNVHFKYMIGDRTGVVHIGGSQILDLERPEIDLPFDTYVYPGQ